MATSATGSGSPMGFGGPFGNTRRVLREEVGRVFGMYESTATSLGSTTSIVDAALARFANDYWINAEAYVKSVAGGSTTTAPAGQSAYVTDFVSSSGTLTVSPAYTYPVDTDATYQLYRWVTTGEINRAVAEAARGAEIATSLTADTDSFDYDLAGAVGLSRRSQIIDVFWRNDGDVEVMPQRIIYWELEEAEGRLYLRIPQTFQTADQLWVVYHADESYLTSDALSVNLPKDLVVARAVVYLIERILPMQDSGGQDRWGQLLRYWAEKLQKLEVSIQRPPKRAKVFHWGGLLGSDTDRADEALDLTPNF